MLEEEEEEDGNVDVSRRRNLDRVEDGDVAMTSVVLTGQSGRRHRLNTGKKLVCLILMFLKLNLILNSMLFLHIKFFFS